MLTFAPENTTVDTTPLFIATFDQRVDPDAVLKTITLDAGGTKVAIRRATTAEIIADDQVHQVSEDTPDGRWIAFRPVSRLPNGAALTVSIGPGTPSAEGPRTTTSASTHTRLRPTRRSRSPAPNAGTATAAGREPASRITFNNAPRPEGVRGEQVTITPAVAASIGVSGNTLTINAATKRDTHYVVHLPATLRDEFGQTLGAATTEIVRRRRSDTGADAVPRAAHHHRPVDAKRPSVSVTSVGHPTLRVDVYATDPSRWLDYQNLLERWDGTQSLGVVAQAVDDDDRGRRRRARPDRVDDRPERRSSRPHRASHRRGLTDPAVRPGQRPLLAEPADDHVGAGHVDRCRRALDATTSSSRGRRTSRDGSPLGGVQVHLGGTDSSAVTDAGGLARLRIVRARYLTATKGADVALLPADSRIRMESA